MPRKLTPLMHNPTPDLAFEQQLWEKGLHHVAGIDEAGRGALAGPVSAAAVVLPPNPGVLPSLWGVRDSKQMTPFQREVWAERIRDSAFAFGVGFATSEEIDKLGIVPATCLAVSRALEALPTPPQHLLIDYLAYPQGALPQTLLVKGDVRCLSIAAASILAKTGRDDLMRQFDRDYPGYGFYSHKGYGTLAHRQALSILGLSPIHRRRFRLRG